jgi:hypothetical protein
VPLHLPGTLVHPHTNAHAALSFDDATDAALGLAIPSGYKNLRWDNFGIMDGDSYQTHNGYFSGASGCCACCWGAWAGVAGGQADTHSPR